MFLWLEAMKTHRQVRESFAELWRTVESSEPDLLDLFERKQVLPAELIAKVRAAAEHDVTHLPKISVGRPVWPDLAMPAVESAPVSWTDILAHYQKVAADTPPMVYLDDCPCPPCEHIRAREREGES